MDFLLQARQILSDCLFVPIEKISENEKINDIKPLDSLTFELIMAQIETVTQKEINPAELLNVHTVKELAHILEKYSQ